MTPRPQSNAIDYFKAADGHLTAAKLLEPHTGLVGVDFAPTNSLFLAYYNVLGFSVELYLKSYLSFKGYTSDQLSKKPFGHDLISLHKAALNEGLLLHKDAVHVIVQALATNHGDYTYRYLHEGATLRYFAKGEPTEIVLAALSEIHNYIAHLIGVGG